MLKERQRTLLAKKISQQNLINEIKDESINLESLKEKQSIVISELNKKESELRTELEKQKKSLSSLNNLISNVIAKEKNNRKVPASRKDKSEEIAKREKKILESREKNASAKKPENPEPVKEVLINKPTGSFAANKKKLQWPVEGFISDKFGVKPHPVLKGLKIDNNGVDIQTSPRATVRTVFEGIVLDISQIPGLNNVIAVQHGDYYTVYANLESVNVRINQEVSINQSLGTVAYKDGSPEINFQIWHNFDKLNPESWLGSK
jgi:septal ring factor EnvC (AmiA/AmiB activator)